MNLHQFRFVREAVRQNFNLTEAAKALHTSQPGVSKAIIELEEGPRMLSNLINIKPDPALIRCDMPVNVVYVKQNDNFTLPFFQPAEAK